MPNFGSKILPALIVTILIGLNYYGQSADTYWNIGLEKIHKSTFYLALSPEEKEILIQHWNEIGTSLEKANTGFEGTYGKIGYEGGYFLRFSLEKGYILIPYYDQSMISDFSYGRVEIKNKSEILLAPEKEMTGAGRILKRTPLEWLPVHNANYIVPKSEIRSFGLYYGGFGIYNGFPRKIPCDGCGTFAERVDERKGHAVENFPAPPAYIKYLRKPITAKITHVGKKKYTQTKDLFASRSDRSSVTPVQINVGRQQGVTRGLMFLLVDAGDNFYQVLKITRVFFDRSEGVVSRNIDKNKNEVYNGDYDKSLDDYVKIPFPVLKVGTKVTTSSILN